MFILIYILCGLLVAVAILAGVVANRPADFEIARSIHIAAPAEIIFSHVNDLHAWAAWSPWEHLDPNMKKTFSGNPTGVGAIYEWSGNSKAGHGRMTVEKSELAKLISMKLEFFKPFKATNQTNFTFTPDAGGTKVNWSMVGRNNFVAKIFSLLMNIDKLVGRDFEKGLASLKSISEAA